MEYRYVVVERDGTLDCDGPGPETSWSELVGQKVQVFYNWENEKPYIKYEDIKDLSPYSRFDTDLPLETIDECIKNNFNIKLRYREGIKNLGNLNWEVYGEDLALIPKDQFCNISVVYNSEYLEDLQQFTNINKLTINLYYNSNIDYSWVPTIRCRSLVLKYSGDDSLDISDILKSEYIEELYLDGLIRNDNMKAVDNEILENNYTLLKTNIESLSSLVERNNQYFGARRFARVKVAV
jgi:hypothetical protein